MWHERRNNTIQSATLQITKMICTLINLLESQHTLKAHARDTERRRKKIESQTAIKRIEREGERREVKPTTK